MIEAISNEKRRVAGPLLKSLPPTVAKRVRDLAYSYKIKSAAVVTYPHGWKIYAGEGYRFELILGDQTTSVEMVSEFTLGASGLSHDIGATGIPPVGAWIIQIHYYNKYWMDIINIVEPQIEGGTCQRLEDGSG